MPAAGTLQSTTPLFIIACQLVLLATVSAYLVEKLRGSTSVQLGSMELELRNLGTVCLKIMKLSDRRAFPSLPRRILSKCFMS